MSFKLYELTEMYHNVLEVIESDEGDNEDLEKALSTIEGDIEDKAENIAKLIKNIDADIKALRGEENRLASKRKSLANKQKNIKEYMEHHLEAIGIDKVKTPIFTVAIQNNPPSVNFTDKDLIPEKYKEEVITTKIPKKAILDDLKEGIEVPGTEIKQTRSLRIR